MWGLICFRSVLELKTNRVKENKVATMALWSDPGHGTKIQTPDSNAAISVVFYDYN